MGKKKNKKKIYNDPNEIIERLLRFEDNLAGIQFSIDAYNDLKLTDDIDEQMDDTLHGYTATGVLEAHAQERYSVSKVELDEFHGELDEHAREIEIMSRPTDARVKAWIDRNDEYVRRKKRLIELERKWNVLKHLNRAFYMRYELLRTKSANLRKEIGDLSAAPTRIPRPKKRKYGGRDGS